MGELRYGLGYPQGKGRYVTQEEFPNWLAQARLEGQVALLLRTDDDEQIAALPTADKTIRSHRFTLLVYHGNR